MHLKLFSHIIFIYNSDSHDYDKEFQDSENVSLLPKTDQVSSMYSADFDDNFGKNSSLDKKSHSEKGMDINSSAKDINKSDSFREHEYSHALGDGLHVKKVYEDDISDSDEVPEPIPKDYPEIGVIEGKQFLSAIGLGEFIFFFFNYNLY